MLRRGKLSLEISIRMGSSEKWHSPRSESTDQQYATRPSSIHTTPLRELGHHGEIADPTSKGGEGRRYVPGVLLNWKVKEQLKRNRKMGGYPSYRFQLLHQPNL